MVKPSMKVTIEGLDEIESMFRKLEKVPQAVVTQSAKDGAKIALNSAKNKAPHGRYSTGDLKKGLIMLKERKTVNGKAVYYITLNRTMNDIFVKESKEGKRAYYPASMEYGFIARNGRKVPGHHYLKNAIVDNKSEIEQKMLSELDRRIDLEMKKG